MDERPYLDTHVIRESEHFYSLKAEEAAAAASSSSSLTSKPVKNVQQNIKELQVQASLRRVLIAYNAMYGHSYYVTIEIPHPFF